MDPSGMIGGVISGIGSIIGGTMAADALDRASQEVLKMVKETVAEYQAIGLPPEQALKVSLSQYKQAGTLSPELENLINQNPTEMLGIQSDPRLRDAEMAALREYADIYEGGGTRLQDKANYERALSDLDQRDRAKRLASELDFASRGASTGGGALVARLLNDQSNAQARYQAGLDMAANAENFALQSIVNASDLAGKMATRDFSQQAEIAQAQDVINRMNTEAARGVQQRNVSARNAAQEANLSNTQSIWNANTDILNQEEKYNKTIPQTMFDNAMNRQNAISNARSGQAQQISNIGANQASMWGGIGSAINNVGTGIGAYNKGVQPAITINSNNTGQNTGIKKNRTVEMENQ